LREDNNIVDINTTKIFKLTKLSIYYSLNVDERIFEFYSNNIKLFFVSINNKEELIFVFKCNQELQKENQFIYKIYVLTITNLNYNVCLDKYRISIGSSQFI